MRFRRLFACVCLATVTSAGVVAATSVQAQTPYDGQWSVTIVTKSGNCEPTAQYPLVVTDGKISAPGADISGKVGPAGLVKVSFQGAYANGQLSGNAGSGKWNGASGGIPCSGNWQASRQ